MKHYVGLENKVNEKKYILWDIYIWNNKTTKKLFSFMSNVQAYYHFKLDFQKVEQHTGGKWLIFHGTKRRKDNQLQSPESPPPPPPPLQNIRVGNVNTT